MALTVRAATRADVRRVAEIKVANWTDTYAALLEPAVLARFLDVDEQEAHLAEDLANVGILLLVANDAESGVVGFALTHVDARPEPWLESLHVVSACRGTGTGTALMRATAAELLARGRHALRLGVIEGNEAAAHFYDRLGALRTGREPATWAAGVWHEIFRWPDLRTLTIPPE